MARKKQLIIPVFIPFGGCPQRCVFCNQEKITGASALPGGADVRSTVEKHLATWKGSGKKEIAFYGGSFTGLDEGLQREYLETAYGFILAGRVDSIRVSTRPDYISEGSLRLLKDYGVETVELGVESMSDEVLRLSLRGHLSDDTRGAVRLLRARGFRVGIQLMPGLPGDSAETAIETAKEAAALMPEFVRIYPALVIRDTALHRMYLEGGYTPWGLDETVRVLKVVCGIFERAGIRVARVGLHASKELERNIIAGPHHPSLRTLLTQP